MSGTIRELRINFKWRPGEFSHEECVFTWVGIAARMGFHERTLRRYCAKAGVRLPHWGLGEECGVVYLPVVRLNALREIIFKTLSVGL